ncbi:MAG: hypothetical protein M3524_08790 [Actinomycetota bacterium]|nr:hypothetical protein [Actinomycetota bacterium]
MSDGRDSHKGPRRQDQLLDNLARMVQAGRFTMEEAERLRAAANSSDFDDVVGDIRRRHIQATVDAAVEDGGLTQEEADAMLERVENGEDPRLLRDLRRSLHAHRRRTDAHDHDIGTP